MDIEEIKERAQQLGIYLDNKCKLELIHEIQRREGCTPCYGGLKFSCPYFSCCWREDCLGTFSAKSLITFKVE